MSLHLIKDSILELTLADGGMQIDEENLNIGFRVRV